MQRKTVLSERGIYNENTLLSKISFKGKCSNGEYNAAFIEALLVFMDKFFGFLKSEYFSDRFEPEIVFTLQEKSEESVPDATITQEGFKIVVETKMSDWFHSDQLLRHLKSFKEERNKVLITIAPELMAKDKKAKFEEQLREYNENHDYPVIHINTTFELLAEAVQGVIDDRDYEMQDVLDDYLNYCYNDSLILVPDSWKWMRVQLAGTTFDFNINPNNEIDEAIYYDAIEQPINTRRWIAEHGSAENITIEEIIFDPLMNKEALNNIFNSICRAFYKSSEYSIRQYKYAYLRDVPKNKRVPHEQE